MLCCQKIEAGFVINTQKSIWQSQRELTGLGVNINLDKLCFSIPQTRMESIFFSFEKIIKNLPYTTARKSLWKIDFNKVCYGKYCPIKNKESLQNYWSETFLG